MNYKGYNQTTTNLTNKRYERAIKYFDDIVINRYPFHVVALYCRALAYRGLDKYKKSVDDFKTCAKQIRNNKNSQKMYQRYNENMKLLSKYLTDEEIKSFNLDSNNIVNVLPTVGDHRPS